MTTSQSTASIPGRRPPYVLAALVTLAVLHGLFILLIAGNALTNAGADEQLAGRSSIGIWLQLLQDQGHFRRLLDAGLFWIGAIVYLLPLLIAERRQHADIVKIALVDLFFGWSVLGWAISLVWSVLPARGFGRLAEEAGSRKQRKVDRVKARAGSIRQTPPASEASRPRLSYVPPPEGTPCLITDMEAVRDLEGQIRLVGTSLLPYGTPLRIIVTVPNAEPDIVGSGSVAAGGSFVSEPFTLNGRPLPPGDYSVGLTAGPFDHSRYAKDLVEAVGPGGANLPLSATVPDDPEFPEHGRHVEERRALVFGPLAPETAVIEQVKQAKLTVTDRSPSTKTVEDVIRAHFQATPGAQPVYPAWAARQLEPGRWSVTFSYKRNLKRGSAEWHVDTGSGAVRYADPVAKALSYG